MIKKLFSLLIIYSFAAGLALGEQQGEAQDYLTKGDIVNLLSATDFVKKKAGELFSWSTGYDPGKINRSRLTPAINFVKVVPRKAPPDGSTVLEVYASIEDPGGIKNISGVRADLSPIGRLANTSLVDSGKFGDQKANDGVFTLQSSVARGVSLGTKDILIAAANKKGWLALAKTSLDVLLNPVIIEARADLSADGTVAVIMVKIDNPGRLEDVVSVAANLKSLGFSESLLRNDGEEGDLAADDETWSISFPVSSALLPGDYAVPIQVVNQAGGAAAATISLKVGK